MSSCSKGMDRYRKKKCHYRQMAAFSYLSKQQWRDYWENCQSEELLSNIKYLFVQEQISGSRFSDWAKRIATSSSATKICRKQLFFLPTASALLDDPWLVPRRFLGFFVGWRKGSWAFPCALARQPPKNPRNAQVRGRDIPWSLGLFELINTNWNK